MVARQACPHTRCLGLCCCGCRCPGCCIGGKGTIGRDQVLMLPKRDESAFVVVAVVVDVVIQQVQVCRLLGRTPETDAGGTRDQPPRPIWTWGPSGRDRQAPHLASHQGSSHTRFSMRTSWSARRGHGPALSVLLSSCACLYAYVPVCLCACVPVLPVPVCVCVLGIRPHPRRALLDGRLPLEGTVVGWAPVRRAL